MNVANNLASDVPIINIRQFPGRAWVREAACAGHDPELFFAEHATGSYAEARTICAACPVTTECLTWAVETNTQFGMWGGLAPHQRAHLRRRRRHHAP